MPYTNLFETDTRKHFEGRIQQLTPETKPLWGKMNVAQMMAHCTIGLEQTMSQEKPAPRNFISKLLRPLFKGMLTNNKPYKPGTPTSPIFVTLGQDKNFDAEKAKLLKTLAIFSEGGEKVITPFEHPFFGNLTKEQWNRAQCKHLNHHLTQFGV
jgi:hypothetical protein